MARALAALLLAACLALAAPAARAADMLVADLSSHEVALNTGFTGTDVLLFGEAEESADVLVVVRGPVRPEMVRRKGRVLGVWLNRAHAVVQDAPAYYRVAATRPLETVMSDADRDRYGVGVDRLQFRIQVADAVADLGAYRAALLRLKERARLYAEAAGTVRIIGGRLFRTEIDLPANIPTGVYTVAVYLVRDGELVSARTTPLIVSRTGIAAEIFEFATRRAAAYGLLAVLLAAAAGGLAAAVFRKG